MLDKKELFENVRKFPDLSSKGYKVSSLFINYTNNILTFGGVFNDDVQPKFRVSIEDDKGQVDEKVRKLEHENQAVFLNVRSNFNFLRDKISKEKRDSYSVKSKSKIISVYAISADKTDCLDLLVDICGLESDNFLPFFNSVNMFPESEIRQFTLKSIYIWFDIFPVDGNNHGITHVLGNYFKDDEVINVEIDYGCDCFPDEPLHNILFPSKTALEKMRKEKLGDKTAYFTDNGKLLFFNDGRRYLALVGYRKNKKPQKNKKQQELFAEEFIKTLDYALPSSTFKFNYLK